MSQAEGAKQGESTTQPQLPRLTELAEIYTHPEGVSLDLREF